MGFAKEIDFLNSVLLDANSLVDMRLMLKLRREDLIAAGAQPSKKLRNAKVNLLLGSEWSDDASDTSDEDEGSMMEVGDSDGSSGSGSDWAKPSKKKR